MSTENKSILRLIKLTYSGEELDMQLAAWEIYPTLTTDCNIRATQKKYLRDEYVKLMKKQQKANA